MYKVRLNRYKGYQHSFQCIDLLERLLMSDSEQRIGIDEVMEHEFFRNSDPKKQFTSEVIDNIEYKVPKLNEDLIPLQDLILKKDEWLFSTREGNFNDVMLLYLENNYLNLNYLNYYAQHSNLFYSYFY